MRILTNILILFLTIIVASASAQDGVFKFKKVTIGFSEIHHQDSLISLELFQDAAFISKTNDMMGNQFQSHFDTSNGTYTLQYAYFGIGGGSDNRMTCPHLFAKLNFITPHNQEYFQLIPIALHICSESQIHEITVLNIDLNQMIPLKDKMIFIRENEKYEIVNSDNVTNGKLYKIEIQSTE
jgi:hypothetical protein